MLLNSGIANRHPCWRAAGGPLAVLGVLLLFRGALLLGSVPSGIDNTFFHLPFYSLRALEFFPLWNPFEFCGLPLAGNPQFGLFYPPAFIFVWPDAPAAYRLFIFAHYYWAGLGMWFAARRWRLGWSAALLAAATFMCGGYLFGRVSNPVVFLGCAWMPWVLWAAHRAWSSGRAADTALAGAVFALMAHAGSPHGMVYGAILTALFLAMAAAAPRWTMGESGEMNYARETRALQTRARRLWRGGGLLALGVAVYLGLHAPALLPAIEHLGVSARGAATFDDVTHNSLSWRWAPALILGGNRLPEYTDATAYIGLMPWLAVLLAAALGRAERRWAFPLLLMAAGLGLALGRNFIFYRALAALPVGGELIGPMRALILWTLGASLLGGMAFDQLRGVERRRLFVILAGAILAAAAAALLWAMSKILPEYRATVFLRARAAPPDLFVWLNLGLVLGFMALWLAVAGWKPRERAFCDGLFIALVIADLLHFAPRVFIFFRDETYFNPPPAYAAVAPAPDSPFGPRVMGLTPTQIFNESEDDLRPAFYLQPKMNDLFRVPMAEGFDPVFIRRYGELVLALGLREPLDDPFRTVRFTSARHPFVNFAQVGFVIGNPWERTIARRQMRIVPPGQAIPLTGEGEWEKIGHMAMERRSEAGSDKLSPPPRLRAVRLLHYTGGSLNCPAGWEAGRVVLWRGGEEVAVLPVRMGESVADQMALSPESVSRHMAPSDDAVWPAIEFTVYHVGDPRTAAYYLAELRLPEPIAADRVTLERRPDAPAGFAWVVEAVSVIDEMADDGFELVMPHRASPVWRNRRVQPFAWAARGVERAADDAAGLARLREFSAHDWAERAVIAPLESDGGAPLPEGMWNAADGDTTPRVTMEWLSMSELRLHTDSARPFLIVLSQLWHPGWRAEAAGGSDGNDGSDGTSGGRSAEGGELFLHRVNHAFQGIAAPAGRHTIRLRFWPRGLTPGLIAAAAAIGALGMIGGVEWRRKMKARGGKSGVMKLN